MVGQSFSGSLPKYTSNGGPNGKGSLFFNGASNINAGVRTYNIVTNGGFTFVSVLRRANDNAVTIFDAASILYSDNLYGRILITGSLGYAPSSYGYLKLIIFAPSPAFARTVECEKSYVETAYVETSPWLTVVIQINSKEVLFSINDQFVTKCYIQYDDHSSICQSIQW
jgi:hypothetical protein